MSPSLRASKNSFKGIKYAQRGPILRVKEIYIFAHLCSFEASKWKKVWEGGWHFLRGKIEFPFHSLLPFPSLAFIIVPFQKDTLQFEIGTAVRNGPFDDTFQCYQNPLLETCVLTKWTLKNFQGTDIDSGAIARLPTFLTLLHCHKLWRCSVNTTNTYHFFSQDWM